MLPDKEICPRCRSHSFSIARNMIGTRICKCGTTWVPSPKTGMKECITHHICDCQQSEIDSLRKQLEQACSDPVHEQRRVYRELYDNTKEKLVIAIEALEHIGISKCNFCLDSEYAIHYEEIALEALKSIKYRDK